MVLSLVRGAIPFALQQRAFAVELMRTVVLVPSGYLARRIAMIAACSGLVTNVARRQLRSTY